MKTHQLSLLALLIAGTAMQSARADWLPTGPGSYSYNDTANWSDGSINGAFSSALTGDQTITFNADTSLPTAALRALDFSYAQNFGMTLQSDSATARVLTLSGADRRIVAGASTAARTITLGTISNPLEIDLGTSGTRYFQSGAYTSLDIQAKITGGNATSLVSFSTGGTNPGNITLRNDANDFTSDLYVGITRNLRVTSVADAGMASAIGAGDLIRFANGTSGTTLEYIGAAASTDRTVRLESTAPTTTRILNTGTGELTFTGSIVRAGTTPGAAVTLELTGTAGITVSGTIEDGTVAGAFGLLKNGVNTVTLSGDNLYTGTTVVNLGTLLVDGDQSAATGATSVAAAANLGGSGIIGGAVTISGTVSAGNGVGTLTLNDDLTLNAGSTALFELGGAANYDQIILTGGDSQFSLGGTLVISLLEGFDPTAGNSFDLFDWAGNFVDNGYTFDFTNAALADGLQWDVSQFSANGTIAVIPEPATLGLVGAGWLGLIGLNLLKKRHRGV